jgi:hypothetical protein
MTKVRDIDKAAGKTGFVQGEIPVRGQKIPTFTGDLHVSDLRYYADNPRVYSLVHENGIHPDQEEIEEKLQAMDHVKELIQDIRSHGGLIEPLIVRDETLDVLEGNSRLAAYRALALKDPIKWGTVKCTILPADVSDAAISALLSQLHLKGKREWPPYEQAGHIYRRSTRGSVDIDQLHAETGLAKLVLTRTIEAYELMVAHNDDKRERWSYYLELVKSNTINKLRKTTPKFDKLIVSKIHSCEIKTAQDLRDKLPVICKSPSRTIKKFLDGRLDFEEAYEEACEGGADNRQLSRLHKFRVWLADSDVQEGLVESEKSIKTKVQYEINHLLRIVGKLEKKMA